MTKADKWIARFNTISSTNLRICVTLLVVFGTALHYWITAYVPDSEWLIFLGAMAGIDVAHFTAKRASYKLQSKDTTQ